jgi:hypothetical protein
MANAVSKFIDRISGAKDAVARLHEADRQLREQIDREERDKQRLIAQPAPREEVFRTLELQVDAHGAGYRHPYARQLVTDASGAVLVGMDGTVEGVRSPSLGELPARPLSFAALCALCPEAVKQGLRAMVASVNYEAGPPMAERAALIEKINARIGDVAREHEELVDEARTVGIHLEHLPIVKGQRARAAALAERQARDVRDNAVYYQRHPDKRPTAS